MARSGWADDGLSPPRSRLLDGVRAAFRLDASLSLVGFCVSLLFVGGTLLAGGRTAADTA